MAECQDCNQEMLDPKTTTCDFNGFRVKETGEILPRVPVRSNKTGRCHDCNIRLRRGNYHHFGCDMERCPKCGGQLISCGCFDKKPSGTYTLTPIDMELPIKGKKNERARLL